MINQELKAKYPYWYSNAEKHQEQQRIDRLIQEAEYRITQFVDMKMNEIEARISEIERSIQQTRYNIDARLNDNPLSNSAINREVNKMIIKEFESALR